MRRAFNAAAAFAGITLTVLIFVSLFGGLPLIPLLHQGASTDLGTGEEAVPDNAQENGLTEEDALWLRSRSDWVADLLPVRRAMNTLVEEIYVSGQRFPNRGKVNCEARGVVHQAWSSLAARDDLIVPPDDPVLAEADLYYRRAATELTRYLEHLELTCQTEFYFGAFQSDLHKADSHLAQAQDLITDKLNES